MKNRKLCLGMLVLTLVFGMTVIGCGGEVIPEQDNTPSPQPGDDYDNPIDRVENIALGTMTSSDSGWRQLLNSISSTGKYVNLDLSACTMNGTSFNPDPSVGAYGGSKKYIVSIILPTVATSIEAGTSFTYPAFFGFNLKSISGANIITIGDNAFVNIILKNASFPQVTTIGKNAFVVTNLVTLNIPKVTTIGESAFRISSNALTITMGSTAPSTLSPDIFLYTTTQVKVKVPSGATGYTPLNGTSITISGTNNTTNWANGFRGGGWNGSTLTDASKINQNITLTIEQQ